MPKKPTYEQLENALCRIRSRYSKRIHTLFLRLLSEKFDFETPTFYGRPLLRSAAVYGNIQLAQLLISEKVSLDSKDSKGETALDYAVFQGQIDIINVLLTYGATIQKPKELYDFLRIVKGPKTFLPLVALYKQQKKSLETTGEYKELNQREFVRLEKIARLHELHQANIYRSIDNGTKGVMPDALLHLISQYNSPEENTVKELDQHFSFFRHRLRFDAIITREKNMEDEQLSSNQKTQAQKRHRESVEEPSITSKKIAK